MDGFVSIADTTGKPVPHVVPHLTKTKELAQRLEAAVENAGVKP